MKIIRTDSEGLAKGSANYQVESVSRDDIKRPSKYFLQCARDLKGFSFLNEWTADAFAEQVRDTFANE